MEPTGAPPRAGTGASVLATGARARASSHRYDSATAFAARSPEATAPFRKP